MPTPRPPSETRLRVRRFTAEEAQYAISLLESRIADVRALNPDTLPYDDEKVLRLERRIKSTILEVFHSHSLEYRDCERHQIGRRRVVIRGRGYEDDVEGQRRENQDNFRRGIAATITMLQGHIVTVRERTRADKAEASPTRRSPTDGTGPNRKVFVVHGRQHAPRDAVARFLSQLGLEPIILNEQASNGRTIIEKFERHSDVGFAVVLLTADDRGGPMADDPHTYSARARQNVILELGYFVGALRRARVFVLYEPGVEIPSDFHGVVYEVLDAAGAWKFTLAREMKAADLDVDLNRAVR